MESDHLKELIQDCPLVIRMNDDREYYVEKPEFITVGDYTAGVLFNNDGVMMNGVLSLLNIATVIPHAAAAGN